MSTRILKLKLLTRLQLVTIETSVRNLGEFKELPEVKELNINWGQSKLVDRATQNTIELDTALLPNIDSILFISVTKTSSGVYTRSELYTIIKEYKQQGGVVNFNYTQTTTSKLQEFVSSISDTTKKVVTPEASNVSNKNSAVVEISDLADFVTTNTLQKEAVEITSKLKK